MRSIWSTVLEYCFSSSCFSVRATPAFACSALIHYTFSFKGSMNFLMTASMYWVHFSLSSSAPREIKTARLAKILWWHSLDSQSFALLWFKKIFSIISPVKVCMYALVCWHSCRKHLAEASSVYAIFKPSVAYFMNYWAIWCMYSFETGSLSRKSAERLSIISVDMKRKAKYLSDGSSNITSSTFWKLAKSSILMARATWAKAVKMACNLIHD